MSSFRNYSDAGAYRSRTGIGSSSTFGRNASTGSNFSNYRNNYTGISSTPIKASTMKERNISSPYGNKNAEKERPISKTSNNDSRSSSRCSSRTSTPSFLDKYSLGSSKSTERPSSVLDRYRIGGTSREPSRESDNTSSKYDSADKKDKEPLSYRGLRSTATESSIENKSTAYRVNYSRTPTLGKSNNSLSISESSSSPRYTGTTSNSRYLLPSRNNPERVTATIGYTGSEKFCNTTAKSTSSTFQEDIPKAQQCQNKEANQNEEQSEILVDENKTNIEQKDAKNNISENLTDSNNGENNCNDIIVLFVVTRGTSPTPPPALTAFTRTKRLEPIPKPVRKEVKRSEQNKKIVKEQEQQMDSSENFTRDRYTRYSSTSGRTPWVSSYLDKFGTSSAVGNSSSYSSRTSYAPSHHRVTNSFGYSRSNENAYSSKDSSTRSTSSSHDADQHHRSNSSYSPSSNSNVRTCDRLSPKVEPYQKKRTSEDGKSDASREASPRIVEGQDHGQGSSSRRESSSKSSESTSSSSTHSKPGNISRSGSLKSRHTASSETSSAVSVPAGCNGNYSNSNSSSSRSASSKLVSSTSSPAAAASMTKIKSAGTTTTSSGSSSTSNVPTSSGKCASVSAGSSVNSRQATPADARDRKPPVPKSEMVGKNTTTAGGGSGIKYVNKDFRKSALNMENGDPSRSQISERKLQKKYQRSVSASSQDSQSEANSESPAQQVVSSGSSTSLKSNKSLIKSRTPSFKSSSVSKGDQKSFSAEIRRSSSKSPSSVKTGRACRTMSVSTSDCSSGGSSSESSNSDGEGDQNSCLSNSSFQGKISAGSSRTSVLASSADELSANTDKPPRPPVSPRSRSDKSGKNEEAKSFIMRALAPVTNLFKTKENGADIKNGGWVESECEDNSESAAKNLKNSLSKSVSPNLTKSPSFTNSENAFTEEKKWTGTGLRHQSSEEKPWWLDPNSDNVPEGVERNPSVGNDDMSQDTTISTVLPDDGKFKFKVWRQDSEERAWWLDDNDNNIPDEDLNSCPKEPPPPVSPSSTANLGNDNSCKESTRGGSTRSSFRSAKSQRAARLKHQQSGERAWWMSDDPENVPEGIEVIPVSPAVSSSQDTSNSSSNQQDSSKVPIGKRIRRIESGERPWWLDSSPEVPDGVQTAQPAEASSSSSTDDSSESFERLEIRPLEPKQVSGGADLSKFPVDDEPLGDRASPEGIENPPDPPDSYGGRSSPYDNVSSSRTTPPRRSAPRKRPANLPLFIGTHKNIDDLLGEDTDFSHSPDRSSNKKQQYSGGMTDSGDEECEEIDAAQVIIHDSTPQTPVIQRRHRDTDRPQPDGYIPVREPLEFYVLCAIIRCVFSPGQIRANACK